MKDYFQTIIFDFDYTLADSSRGIVQCINYGLVQVGLPAVEAERACRTIGLALPAAFLELAGVEHAARSDEFLHHFKTHADEVMVGQTVLYEGVPAMVEELKRRQITRGIVSNKYRYRIEAVLQREGILRDFTAIVGSEDFTKHKPDPEGLHIAIQRLSAIPSRTLYVGDSVTDAETARRAGVPFVAILTGVTPRAAFANYDLHAILDRVDELTHLLEYTK